MKYSKRLDIRVDEETYHRVFYLSGGRISEFIRDLLKNLDSFFDPAEELKKLDDQIIELEKMKISLLEKRRDIECLINTRKQLETQKSKKEQKFIEEFMKYYKGANQPSEINIKNWLSARNDLLVEVGFTPEEALKWLKQQKDIMKK